MFPAMSDRRVHIGNISETPRKVFTYRDTDPTNCVIAATPTRKNEKYPLKSSLHGKSSSSAIDDDMDCEHEDDGTSSSRPKTSRGTSHPSPDAFYDYVTPSPPRRGGGTNKFMISFPHLEKEKNVPLAQRTTSATKKSRGKVSLKTKDRSAPEKSQLHDCNMASNLESALKRQDEAIFIGCWLFGSLLRVWKIRDVSEDVAQLKVSILIIILYILNCSLIYKIFRKGYEIFWKSISIFFFFAPHSPTRWYDLGYQVTKIESFTLSYLLRTVSTQDLSVERKANVLSDSEWFRQTPLKNAECSDMRIFWISCDVSNVWETKAIDKQKSIRIYVHIWWNR